MPHIPPARSLPSSLHTDAAFTGDNEDGAEEAPLAAAVAAAALPSDVEALGAMLADLPWEMVITRDAWHSWLAMDPPFRQACAHGNH